MIAAAEPVRASSSENKATQIESLLKTVSASRLICWSQCRLKFFFRYVQQISKSPTPSLHVGSIVHLVLKAWSMARWRKQAFSVEVFRAVFEKHWNHQPAKINWDGEEAGEKTGAWGLLEMYFSQTPIQVNDIPEAVEVPAEADLSNHGLPKLIGILDLVRSGGRIVDFKTSGKTPDAEDAIHLNETQLSCYSILYREAAGKRESGRELHHLVKTKVPKLVVTELGSMDTKQETRLFRIMDSYMQGLDREDFVPSPGLQCLGCEFRNECRLWS